MTKHKAKLNLKIWIPVAAVVLLIIISLVLLMSSKTRVAFLNIEDGSVEVDKGKGWLAAEDGMKLSIDDKVRTGADGKAVVILYESILVELDPDTEITIEELSKKNVKIHQSSGSTWNKFAAIVGIQNFQVETPTTVATVRGTAFWVDMDSVGLESGKLDVVMDGKKMSLTPNFKAVRDGTQVLPFNEADRQRAILKKQLVISHLKDLRQQEIEKHKVMYNLIKKVRGYTDADMQRYMDKADRGELNVQDLRKRTVLPAKSVDKFVRISEEIKKQQAEMSQLKGAQVMDDGQHGDGKVMYDGIDGESKAVMPIDPYGKEAMPPEPLK